MRALAGRTAIVTGGTAGIGLAVARLFADEGANVVAVARGSEPASELAADLGDRLALVEGDVADAATAGRAVDCALARFGQLDVLVNNAGVDLSGIRLLDTTLEQARDTFAVNFFGALTMLQACARAMEDRGGAIVNVASRAALVGVPTMAVYGASKGALVSLTRAAAIELAPNEIRVNAVAPGLTETRLVRDWIGAQPDPDAFREAISATIPQGRFASPAEVAAAILFLATDGARHITGTTLSIDGGYTAR